MISNFLLYDSCLSILKHNCIRWDGKPPHLAVISYSTIEAISSSNTLHQRIAFSLIDMFGLSLDEVSTLIGISKNATKGLLYRAHMNLDSFFHNHCNLLDVNNPCSCKAWIEFSKTRSDLQKRANKHNLIEKLDFTKSNYTFNIEVRNKINFLYKNMPDKKPPKEWYERVVKIVNELY